MKKLLILVAALFAVGTVSAQKFARINSQEMILSCLRLQLFSHPTSMSVHASSWDGSRTGYA